jgi:hypothetical protein
MSHGPNTWVIARLNRRGLSCAGRRHGTVALFLAGITLSFTVRQGPVGRLFALPMG